MSIRFILVAVVLLSARAALGQDAHTLMAQAIEEQVDAHASPPSLPTQASQKARTALGETAFGRKGEAERRAHAADAASAAAAREAGPSIGSAASQARPAHAAAQAAAGPAAPPTAKDRAPHPTR